MFAKVKNSIRKIVSAIGSIRERAMRKFREVLNRKSTQNVISFVAAFAFAFVRAIIITVLAYIAAFIAAFIILVIVNVIASIFVSDK